MQLVVPVIHITSDIVIQESKNLSNMIVSIFELVSCLEAESSFFVGSNIVKGTPPSVRAGCGFTAIGSRLFVFAGQTTLPDEFAFGDIVDPLFRFW